MGIKGTGRRTVVVMVVIVVIFCQKRRKKSEKLLKCSVGRNESLFLLSSFSTSSFEKRERKKETMYYVPATDTYCRLPASYVPVYSTPVTRISWDDSNVKLTNDLTRVQSELAELRQELNGLRLEKETCRLCSSTIQSYQCDTDCSICYPCIREREENYSRASSPVHYCSICHDYVIDQEYPPLSPSPRPYSRIAKKKPEYYDDKLSEYLYRQLELQRLRHRYIPEERPIWIPTAYKHDYPYRRWVTRQSYLSEP